MAEVTTLDKFESLKGFILAILGIVLALGIGFVPGLAPGVAGVIAGFGGSLALSYAGSHSKTGALDATQKMLSDTITMLQAPQVTTLLNKVETGKPIEMADVLNLTPVVTPVFGEAQQVLPELAKLAEGDLAKAAT
jgi:hypothetical protein